MAAVGGFALVDSVRGCDTTTPAAATTEAAPPTTTVEPDPPPEEIQDWPHGAVEGILTFVDAETCQIREIGLVIGREREATHITSDCEGLWAPRVGTYIAYSGVSQEDTFRITDLREPAEQLGEFSFEPGTAPVWSPNGLRIAWCDSPTSGFEREMVGGQRALRFCPVAYTPHGELAHIVGSRLVVGGRTVAATGGRIDSAQFGRDGSVGLVVDGLALERYVDGELRGSKRLTAAIELPQFSPNDTCLAAAGGEDGLHLVPLCPGLEERTYPAGPVVSWSPDGSWIAAGAVTSIAFFQVTGGSRELFWPAVPAQLAWRAG